MCWTTNEQLHLISKDTAISRNTAPRVTRVHDILQMKYQHLAAQNGGAAAPQPATEEATGASLSQDGAHGAEKGLFGSAESRSLSDAAKEVPNAVSSIPAAVAGAPAFFASALKETAHRGLAPVPEPARPPGQPARDSASHDSRPGLSSACTLNSGFVAQVAASA